MINSYDIQNKENIPVMLSWLGREGLQFVKTLKDEEKEKCKTSMGLFESLSQNFKPQHNETILSLQFCTLAMEQSENAE